MIQRYIHYQYKHCLWKAFSWLALKSNYKKYTVIIKMGINFSYKKSGSASSDKHSQLPSSPCRIFFPNYILVTRCGAISRHYETGGRCRSTLWLQRCTFESFQTKMCRHMARLLTRAKQAEEDIATLERARGDQHWKINYWVSAIAVLFWSAWCT